MRRITRFIIGAVIILAALSYLIYGGMRQAIVYFKTPSELKAEQTTAKGKAFRIGGMVVQGSLRKDLKTLTYQFQITDGATSIPVYFHGLPPDLFSEGKGAVIEGKLGEDGVFVASIIMAKHAEEYSPPKDGKPSSSARSFIPDKEEKRP
jgi:cytochrome c-type biogenesis protein CcmE